MAAIKTRRQAAAAATATTAAGDAADGNAAGHTENGHDIVASTKKQDGSAPERAARARGDGDHDHDHDGQDTYPRENIFLFWPNIIGYSRIVLALGSLYYMPLHPRTCSLLYSVSCLLDAVDGFAARYFEQSTRFGAVLDMVTDRCTTACLLVFLSSAFPRWAIVFQGLISLDLASHYIHMYATLAMGGSEESHKNVDKSRSWLLNLYYTNKNVLFVCCALNEVFFIALYLLSFSSPLLSPGLLQQVPGPEAAAIRHGAQVNSSLLSQLFTNPYSAGALELARTNKMDSLVPWCLAGISFPVMFFKQFLNVLQMVYASRWLAEGDVRLRREKGLPRREAGGKGRGKAE